MFLARTFKNLIVDFFENLLIILVMHTIAVIALLAFAYVLKDSNNIQDIFNRLTMQHFKIFYIYYIVNATLLLTLHNLIFRGLIAPITLIVAVFIYAAIVKYSTGNYLLFYNKLKDPSMLLLFFMYTYIIYFIGLAFFNRLATAIVYRTREED